MEPVAQALADAAHGLDATAADDLPVMSTLTAEWQPRMDPDHLREHALRPVLFGRAVARLLDEGYDTFVELGPDENLAGPIRAAAAASPVPRAQTAVLCSPCPRPGQRSFRGRQDGTPGGARELLATVGRLWARGVTLDRTTLDAGRRRVPLPPYPYQRRRYWPDASAHGLLHRVTWQAAPLADGAPAGPVLVTGVDATAVRELAEQLAGRGVAATADAGIAAAQTVILLAGPAEHGTVAEFERMQRGWVTAFREALALFDRTGARRLLVVTEDVHVTGHGSERPDPAQAVLGALALAVPEEFPGAVANWVDLASLDDAGQRLRAVLAEAAAPQAAGVVAWRDGRRLVRTVVPQPAETPLGRERLPADGTFLITGGCGGIGSALARDLAGRGRPVVILTGRSPQPPEGLVEELAALGADARYHQADLATQDDVDKLVAELPPLDGVFHAAGVVRPGSLRSTDVQEAVDALRAKTLGTRLLAEALHRHGQRPGVCVAFSSVSSVLPGLAGALGVYAAANAFLDSFAAAERRAGRPWTSVNLGPFAETGLASSLASSLGTGPVARAGSRPLATAPALAALRSACDMDAAQLVLADLTSVRRPVLADPPRRPAAIPPRQAASAAARRPAAADGPTSVSAPISIPGAAAVLRELLAQSLGVPVSAVDDDAPFLSLGLDSLGAVDLVKRLERRTGRPWPTTLFFEYRTVRELAAHLDAQTAAEAGAEAGADAAESGRDAHRAPLPPATHDGTPFALTPVQLALYTSSRLHPDVPARGHLRLTIRGPLDTHVLGRALTALAERHGMLRLRIDGAGTTPMQRLAPAMRSADLVRGVRGVCPERGRCRIGPVQPALRPGRRTAGAGRRTPSGTEPHAPAAGGPSRGGGRVQPQRPGRGPVGPVHLTLARRTPPTGPAVTGLRDVRGSARPLPRLQQPGRHAALLGRASGRAGRTAAAAVRRRSRRTPVGPARAAPRRTRRGPHRRLGTVGRRA